MARRENKEIENGVGGASTEPAGPRGSGSASVADWRWETVEGCSSTSRTSWKRPLAPAVLHAGESKTAAVGGSAPWPAAAQLKAVCCARAARCAGVGACGFGPRLNRAGGWPRLGAHAKVGGSGLPWCPRLPRSSSGWPGPDGPWRASGYGGVQAGANERVGSGPWARPVREG
jgi:hypothetical protein